MYSHFDTVDVDAGVNAAQLASNWSSLLGICSPQTDRHSRCPVRGADPRVPSPRYAGTTPDSDIPTAAWMAVGQQVDATASALAVLASRTRKCGDRGGLWVVWALLMDRDGAMTRSGSEPDIGTVHGRNELSRRRLLAGSGLAAATLLATTSGVAGASGRIPPTDSSGPEGQIVPFAGDHQAGIATSVQNQLAFAAFDVTATTWRDLKALLSMWTSASAAMTAGRMVPGPETGEALAADSGEALGLGPSQLTLTVGFGPSLFDGRFGLASKRPGALADLPEFPGDQLEAAASNGDLCIQACADDAQVAFHAIRNLARIALGSATVRYLQLGFGRTSSISASQSTTRNLLGFKDGTDNLRPDDTSQFDRSVWVGSESDQSWMHGGTYLVARRIRIRIEAWDRSQMSQQEATIGRHKLSGAPLGSSREHDPVDLAAIGPSGAPLVPVGAHIRQASPRTNGGARLLRRGYSYSNGIDPMTGEFDAGLFFICFQRDPRTQFVPIQKRLSTNDDLSQYIHPYVKRPLCLPARDQIRWRLEFRPRFVIDRDAAFVRRGSLYESLSSIDERHLG